MWGLLEMYILLTEDVREVELCSWILYLETMKEKGAPAVDIKLPYKQHQDLFLSLLITRCPVSNGRSIMIYVY